MINQRIPQFEPLSTGEFGMVNFVTGQKKKIYGGIDDCNHDEIQIESTKPIPPPSNTKPPKSISSFVKQKNENQRS